MGGIDSGVRIAHDPVTDALVYLTGLGDLYRIDAPYGSSAPVRIASAADHGLSYPALGFAIGPEGTFYFSGNVRDLGAALNVGVVLRGQRLEGEGLAWETVMQTVPYPLSNAFDHLVNAIAVSQTAPRFTSTAARGPTTGRSKTPTGCILGSARSRSRPPSSASPPTRATCCSRTTRLSWNPAATSSPEACATLSLSPSMGRAAS